MSKDNLSPWDALDLDGEKPDDEKAEKIRLDVKRKFQACFQTEQGKWVLEFLNGKYFNSPVVDEHATNVLASAGIREGEMRLLRYIHLMLRTEK